MRNNEIFKPRRRSMVVIAPAGKKTWAVAFSRRLIPGAVFNTEDAAIGYALAITQAAGLSCANIRVLGSS